MAGPAAGRRPPSFPGHQRHRCCSPPRLLSHIPAWVWEPVRGQSRELQNLQLQKKRRRRYSSANLGGFKRVAKLGLARPPQKGVSGGNRSSVLVPMSCFQMSGLPEAETDSGLRNQGAHTWGDQRRLASPGCRSDSVKTRLSPSPVISAPSRPPGPAALLSQTGVGVAPTSLL